MKIKADYAKVQEVKQLIEKCALAAGGEGAGLSLSAESVKILNQIMSAAEGDIFPSTDEMTAHTTNQRLLEGIDPDDAPMRWFRISDEIRHYENKYC